MIYLDHNATTTLHPLAIAAMMKFADRPYNASSIHSLGRQAKFAIEQARKQLSRLVGIEDQFRDYQITFTSSGTESNNLILSNYIDGEIFISATEHPSILSYSKIWDNINIISVDKNGVLDLGELKQKLGASQSNKKLVSVMLANNETGVIQPLKEIASIAHYFSAQIHSDSIQAPGKMALDIKDLDLDFVSISGHKFGGPIGSSALIAKSKYHLTPIMIGGGQEKNLRSGTENLMAIAGFGAAAEAVIDELENISANMQKMQKKIESSLQADFPAITIAGKGVKRLPNTSLIINPGKKAQTQLIAFDLRGVALSSGSACSSGKVGVSTVLSAMGCSENEISSAIRISVGGSTTQQEVDSFLNIYREINK